MSVPTYDRFIEPILSIPIYSYRGSWIGRGPQKHWLRGVLAAHGFREKCGSKGRM